MYINDDVRNELMRAINPLCDIDALFLFEKIPQKKLNNAAGTYAQGVGVDEAIIMLYDSTVFGSAKEGFLLTTKRLYSKVLLGGKGSFTGIGEVQDVYLDYTSGTEVAVKSLSGVLKISNTGAIDKEFKLYAVVYEAIKALGGLRNINDGGTSGAGTTPSASQLQCTGCGAASSGGNSMECEYCGAPMAMPGKKSAPVESGMFYSDFPGILNFTHTSGIAPTETNDISEPNTRNIYYYYNESDFTVAKGNKYVDTLLSSGYHHDGLNDEGSAVYYRGNGIIHINQPDSFIQVFKFR